MIVTLDELKQHLRIEEDDENEYLLGLIRQAQTAAEDFCRVSFEEDPTDATSDTDDDGESTEVTAPEPVRLAVLLMASFYFENRDIPDMTTYKAMRMAFESLLYPYRDPEKMF